ncbi:MAG TPA: 30S ribosomal protein S17 [Desulfosporosinus sp.]|nr:30S ribosomal protein S17 [Desulfosporosinus sp.]
MNYIGKRKIKIGQVLGTKMEKTAVVGIEAMKFHRLYKKPIRRIKKYKVHDEDGVCAVGDKVQIMETRPLSKEKKWRVVKIILKGKVANADQLNGK